MLSNDEIAGWLDRLSVIDILQIQMYIQHRRRLYLLWTHDGWRYA